MGRPRELFAISASLLLVFALSATYIIPTISGIMTHVGRTLYLFSPSSVCIALATMLCFFATIYSLGMLPFNPTLSLWHFWLTGIGIAVFLCAFYLSTANLAGSRAALWAVLVSPAVVLLGQVLFVWNFIQAILKMHQPQS
jgi:hypothetical protein